jgi:hypothetical protein
VVTGHQHASEKATAAKRQSEKTIRHRDAQAMYFIYLNKSSQGKIKTTLAGHHL